MTRESNTDDDSTDNEPTLTDLFDEFGRAVENAMEEIERGAERAERRRKRRQSPIDRAVEQARKTSEAIGIDIEDELDAIYDDLGKDPDEKSEPETPPADGRYCPSCGEPLTGHQVDFIEDELLNRYRTAINHLNDCGFRGEVIRHDAR